MGPSTISRLRVAATHQQFVPVLSFLAPRFISSQRQSFSSTRPGKASTNPSHAQQTPILPKETQPESKSLKKPLTQAQRDFLSNALRVNQAGELAACLIYTAQTPIIVKAHPHLKDLMKHMHDQEAGHFKTFNSLLAKHRVRPTAMYPLWKVAATALGWGTAVLGREAAMACTEAVETEIGGHYNEQVRELLDMSDEMERNGEEIGSELSELISTIRRIRDEELQHLDIAVENDAKKANPHQLLVDVIRGGCRGAIWVSERV